MENNSSNANYSDKSEENMSLSDEDTISLPTDNADCEPPKEVPDNHPAIETTEMSDDGQEDVAEKVEGDTISHTRLDNPVCGGGDDNDFDGIPNPHHQRISSIQRILSGTWRTLSP